MIHWVKPHRIKGRTVGFRCQRCRAMFKSGAAVRRANSRPGVCPGEPPKE